MPMSNSQTVDRNRAHGSGSKIALADRGRDLPLHVSYPANDFAPPPSPPDIGLGMLLVYAGIAAVTVGIVFAGVLPWALRHEGSGGVALLLAILGTLLAPGFWTGVPPGLAAGGACSAGVSATKGRRLSQAAFVIGVLRCVVQRRILCGSRTPWARAGARAANTFRRSRSLMGKCRMKAPRPSAARGG